MLFLLLSFSISDPLVCLFKLPDVVGFMFGFVCTPKHFPPSFLFSRILYDHDTWPELCYLRGIRFTCLSCLSSPFCSSLLSIYYSKMLFKVIFKYLFLNYSQILFICVPDLYFSYFSHQSGCGWDFNLNNLYLLFTSLI